MIRTAFPYRKVYGAALVLAVTTFGGLLFALFGDGLWDIVSCLLLAAPLCVISIYLVKSARMRSRTQ